MKSKVNPTSPCVSDGFIEVESLPKNSRIEWASHEQSTTSLNNLPEALIQPQHILLIVRYPKHLKYVHVTTAPQMTETVT
ncbi:MAG: hypothetical protein IPK25_16200 [Saprospiraceae bacterium]|nr:hypothetical protein [Saprospiraceae bacterium]